MQSKSEDITWIQVQENVRTPWSRNSLTFTSIIKLSGISGVTQSTVNNIVSGRNHSTTVSTIKKLCDGLEITIEEFFHSELFRNLVQEVK